MVEESPDAVAIAIPLTRRGRHVRAGSTKHRPSAGAASDNCRRGLTGSTPEFDAAGMAEREDIAGGSDTVLATYREIATRFGLGSHAAARVKAKRQIARGHWSAEPANHPADPIRVRIPRAEWGRGPERSAKPPDTPDIKPTRTARGAALRIQLEFERSRADRAEAEVAELRRQLQEQRELAGTAEQESARLRGRLAQALAALDEVRDAVAALNTDVARAVAAYRDIVPALRPRRNDCPGDPSPGFGTEPHPAQSAALSGPATSTGCPSLVAGACPSAAPRRADGGHPGKQHRAGGSPRGSPVSRSSGGNVLAEVFRQLEHSRLAGASYVQMANFTIAEDIRKPAFEGEAERLALPPAWAGPADPQRLAQLVEEWRRPRSLAHRGYQSASLFILGRFIALGFTRKFVG